MTPRENDRKRPTAFISYAQSSPEWQDRVLSFTAALRVVGGVDAEMDLFHRTDHQRWPTFGPRLIETSDFTLIVTDAAYKRRWHGEEKTGVGAGVAREAAALRAIYERDQTEFLRRVKVVLLPGMALDEIPGDLLGDCERFSVESFDEPGLEPLLRSIWGKPKFLKPPLGDIPVLPPQAMAGIEGEDVPGKADLSPAGAEPNSEAASTADARDEAALNERLEWVEGALRNTAPLSADLLREQTTLKASLRALKRARPGRFRRGRRLRGHIPLRHTRAVLAALASVAALAVIAGALVSGSSGSRPAAMVKHGAFVLRAPPGWKASRGQSDLLGPAAPRAVELEAPAGAKLRSAAVGISDAAGPTLLPPAYREQLAGATKRATVALGPLQAYRYTDLRAPGVSDPVTIYAAPSTLGVVTLACQVQAAAAQSAGRRCEEVASTLRLRRGEPFPLGPSRGLGRALDRRLTRLTGRRAELRQKLLGANDADEQAAALTKLSDAFRAAGKGLEPKRVTPESAPALAALLVALRATRDAYAALAGAARKEDRERYATASSSVRGAEKGVNRRLRALRALGYRLGTNVAAGGKRKAADG